MVETSQNFGGLLKTYELYNSDSRTYVLRFKCLCSFACSYCKMPVFWRAGMRKGGKPLPLAFQYLILYLVNSYQQKGVKCYVPN